MSKNKIFIFIAVSFSIITGMVFFFWKDNVKNDTWLVNVFYGDRDNNITKSLTNEIKFLLPASSKIIVKEISKEIVNSRQAEKELKKSGAKLIIFGKIENKKIFLQITASEPFCNYISIDNSIACLLNLKNIEFSDDIEIFNEGNKSLIKYFFPGYIKYLYKDYKTAISIWEKDFQNNPVISFYLGNARLILSQTEKQTKNDQLEARKYYQNALQIADKNKNLVFYQSILNNLGIHYLCYPFDLNSENFSTAKRILEEAVEMSPDWSYEEYGITLNNLSIVYKILYFIEKEKFNSLVIKNLSESLRVFREHKNREIQAVIYNNMGVSYFKTKNGLKENFEEVINNLNTAKNLALKNNQTETFYHIINNLGSAYAYNNETKKASEYFILSQEFFKEDIYPVQFGLLQETLGNILSNMPRTPDESSLIEAIKRYENALRVIDPDTRPLNFAQINSNLGLIYASLKSNKRSDNLKKAIVFYENTLMIFKKELYPLQYANVKNNLGNIFIDLVKLDENGSVKDIMDLLGSAVKYFNEALEIYKNFGKKRELIMTKVNLANAYTFMPQQKKKNLVNAISIFQEALSSPDSKDYYNILQHNMEITKKTLQNLGNEPK